MIALQLLTFALAVLAILAALFAVARCREMEIEMTFLVDLRCPACRASRTIESRTLAIVNADLFCERCEAPIRAWFVRIVPRTQGAPR